MGALPRSGPAMAGAPRLRASPACPARGPGPRGCPRDFPVSSLPGAVLLGGCRGPIPRPSAVQCLGSPVGSCALGSKTDGFRNRVAAVSALCQPHLCRSALCSPPRGGALPRTRTGRPLAGAPHQLWLGASMPEKSR